MFSARRARPAYSAPKLTIAVARSSHSFFRMANAFVTCVFVSIWFVYRAPSVAAVLVCAAVPFEPSSFRFFDSGSSLDDLGGGYTVASVVRLVTLNGEVGLEVDSINA